MAPAAREPPAPKANAQPVSPRSSARPSSQLFTRRATVAGPSTSHITDSSDRSSSRDGPLDEPDRGEALIRQRIRERKREKWLKHHDYQTDVPHSFLSDGGNSQVAPSFSTPAHVATSSIRDHGKSPDVSRWAHLPRSSDRLRPGLDDDPTLQTHSDIFGTDTALSVEDEDKYANEHGTDDGHHDDGDGEYFDGEDDDDEDLDFTVKDRQDALNIEHPFGLPIWKPALYKKSRSIQRTADNALKCTPGLRTSRSSMLGNVVWLLLFGVWISLICFFLSTLLYCVPRGGFMYAHTLYGLGTYILWPFGNYIEAECSHADGHRHGPCRLPTVHEHEIKDEEDENLEHVDTQPNSECSPLTAHGNSALYGGVQNDEEDGHLSEEERILQERKLYHYVFDENGNDIGVPSRIGGIIAYGLVYGLVLFPVLGVVCVLCWGLVVTIPMAKLTWVLIKNLASQPLALHFRSPLQIDTRVLKVKNSSDAQSMLHPGHMAPLLKRKHRKKGTSKRRSVILVCSYRAMGLEYFKYTVGGVNIVFINTIPFIFLTQVMFYVLRPYCRSHGITSGLWATLSNDALIFIMSLASVLPLSYFIGMAVASISTQSSIGMGAVINATFGSIIELILYSIALTDGKASLVEGSIIGSILAAVLLMPGLSMCSGATRLKEQSFNSRSAGVTSTMLIMAIIGILTPTIFYQIYGKFELDCSGCPDDVTDVKDRFRCEKCSYEHISPLADPFFQTNVKGLIYACAVILLLAYAIGLWFSLRTHASQIWNSTPNIMQPEPLPPPLHRASVYKRLFPPHEDAAHLPLHHDGQNHTEQDESSSRVENQTANHTSIPATDGSHGGSSETQVHKSSKPRPSDDILLDAAARMYQYLFNQHKVDDPVQGNEGHLHAQQPDANGNGVSQGGHDAPSWNRSTSLSVLLGCTVMYAIIAEIIVDLVDVVIDGSGLSPKFIGVTLFALVPNTTEFMNAMSFAMNGNIALSLEIGSAYALQVCLIQIPVLVGFSAIYNSSYKQPIGDMALHSFTLIFPRWDIISILFSIFLLTYTYNEARSNYHRGSVLILAYLVLIVGFFYAPSVDLDDPAQEKGRRVFAL